MGSGEDSQTEVLRSIRTRLDHSEDGLSPHAARSVRASRSAEERPHAFQTAFQVDRDRILHTKSFRRLKHKTQVFIAPQQDHYVTRLTHTLEVAQLSRTIARALNLNEDLAEAAALGHDIGHGPFGHAGEEALAECLPEGFRHNYHSVRVLDQLEGSGRGLNLTHEVLDAIAKSSKAREDILAEGWGVPDTLEGQIVKVADAIAYLNHDIGDAIRADILSESDLPASTRDVLGGDGQTRVETIVVDVAQASWAAAGEGASVPTPEIRFSPSIRDAINELRDFMFERVYYFDRTRKAAERGKAVVRFLYEYYVSNPDTIGEGIALPGDSVQRRAADYVAGMTDRFAIRVAAGLGCKDAVGWVP